MAYDGLMRQPASSGFPGGALGLATSQQQPIYSGSQQGAPGIDTIQPSLQGATDHALQTAKQFGVDKAGNPPSKQPTFWLFALLIISVIMLAHVANVEVKG